jgi:hypothetical protein
VSEPTTTGGVEPEAKGPNSYSGSCSFYCWIHGVLFCVSEFPVHHAKLPGPMDRWAVGIAPNGLATVARPPGSSPKKPWHQMVVYPIKNVETYQAIGSTIPYIFTSTMALWLV